MRKENHKRGRIADDRRSINYKNFRKNKEATDFCNHKTLKIKLSAAQVSRQQYLKILKVLREVGILNYSTRGIRFCPVKKKGERR